MTISELQADRCARAALAMEEGRERFSSAADFLELNGWDVSRFRTIVELAIDLIQMVERNAPKRPGQEAAE